MVNKERLEFTLRNLPPTAGWDFEDFCNEFLSSEVEGIRPVGGIHDGGRDAFVYSSSETEGTFIQYSVSEKWGPKIRGTVSKLRENGYAVKELIYCTNGNIIGKSDEVRKKIREEGVFLDIRDSAYFLSRRNSSESTRAASERLAQKYCDQIMAERVAGKALSPSPGDAELSAVLTSLSAELIERTDGKSLENIGMEALLEYSLSGATPEKPKPKAEIYKDFLGIVRSYPPATVQQKVDGLLARLVKKGGRLKYYSSCDGYVLAHSERERLAERHIQLDGIRDQARSEIEGELGMYVQEIGIDYTFDSALFINDTVLILQSLLYERAELTMKAIAISDYSGYSLSPVDEFVESKLSESGLKLSTSENYTRAQQLDIIPGLVERILVSKSPAIQRYFGKISRTYDFLFAIQEVRKIQESVSRLVSSCQILLDANILIPCLCEYLVDEEERTMSNLFRQCIDLDSKLYVTSETVEELATSISAARSIYIAVVEGRAKKSDSELVAAYFRNDGGYSSFFEFVETFSGRYDAVLDIKEFLEEELGVVFKDFSRERVLINEDHFGALWPVFRARRGNRKMYDDERLNELSRNDARVMLLIEKLRELTGSNRSWWFLTRDRNFQSIDHERKMVNSDSLTMNPNYFVKYLGLYARKSEEALPLAFDIAEKGFVPDELVENLSQIAEEIEGLRPYQRKRKLRDYAREIRQSDRTR